MEYIAHYGILGMKWGVRRYQNEDGTLTAAGRKRYSKSDSDGKKVAKTVGKAAAATAATAVAATTAYGFKVMKDRNMTDLEANKKEYKKLINSGVSKEDAQELLGLTDEQLKRRNLSQSELTAIQKMLSESTKLVNETRKVNNESIKKTATYKPMDLSNMTDQELRDRINRANLEKTYTQMFGEKEEISKGQKTVADTLDVAGDVLAFGSTALGIAIAIQMLKNGGKKG